MVNLAGSLQSVLPLTRHARISTGVKPIQLNELAEVLQRAEQSTILTFVVVQGSVY